MWVCAGARGGGYLWRWQGRPRRAITESHCAEDEAETTGTVALAILADYLGETARAAALQSKFEKLMRGRLEGSFWALTEAELDQVLGDSGSD